MDISERLAKAGITGDAAIYDDSDPAFPLPLKHVSSLVLCGSKVAVMGRSIYAFRVSICRSKVAVKVGQKLPLRWVKSCRVRILLLRILGDGRFLPSRSVIESRLELKQKNYFAAG